LLCLESGIRFTERQSANGEDSDEENRQVYEALQRDLRAALEAELRESMRVPVKKQVIDVLKQEYRAELTQNGLDTSIIAAAMKDMRDETRLILKEELRPEVKEWLRQEMYWDVKK
jgi:hypothetical protein